MVYLVCFENVQVIGGGYIGVELTGILNALGSNVSLMCRQPVSRLTFHLDQGLMIAFCNFDIFHFFHADLGDVRQDHKRRT
jgi:glutathione reductase (NADPH)